MRKLFAEFFGTYWLVFGGCGSALFAAGIPFGVFYPLPLYEQEAFKKFVPDDLDLPVTEMLCQSVISLPIHTEMDEEILNHISGVVKGMFKTA